jgi:transcriptional regulator with XRE-family HTH domain
VETVNLLGEFLRARRELTRPEDHGLPASTSTGRRRVPGLRREEVALLAGISAEYYVRLERGRDRHPSAQVVEALARVLELDAESTAYLASLATPAPRTRRTRPQESPPRITPEIRRLLDSMSVPAFVLGPRMDVLAHNELCAAIHPLPDNIVRHVFLDPAAREIYPEWDEVAAESVAALRATVRTTEDDPGLIALVGELSLKSPEFRGLWARHEVRAKAGGQKRMHTPEGVLEVAWETLAVAGSPGQQVVAYFVQPGSEQVLDRLRRRAAAP